VNHTSRHRPDSVWRQGPREGPVRGDRVQGTAGPPVRWRLDAKPGNPRCIQTVTPPDDFKKIVDYWNGEGERPLRQAARRRLCERVERFKAEQCRVYAGVATTLIPAGEAAAAPRAGRN
jgi:hypothetical protein